MLRIAEAGSARLPAACGGGRPAALPPPFLQAATPRAQPGGSAASADSVRRPRLRRGRAAPPLHNPPNQTAPHHPAPVPRGARKGGPP